MTESLTGEQYELAAGSYRAVVTEAGASLRELTWEGRPLVLAHGADEPAPAASGHLLIPWPNRIDRGRYEYAGRTHQLDVSEPSRDCAIHGLVRWSPWQAAEQEPGRARLSYRLLSAPGYPFRLDLEVEYTLDPADGLRVQLTARNTGTRTAPYGYGAHPYLTVGERIDDCTVTVEADSYLPVDDRKLPSGPPRDVIGTPFDLRKGEAFGDRQIDNAFTGLARDADGRLWVTLSGTTGRTTRLWADDAHPWLEIYTADEAPEPRTGLGVEPMTCPPNAFATGLGLAHLEPGAQYRGSWGIMAG